MKGKPFLTSGTARQYQGKREKPTKCLGRLGKVHVSEYDQVGIKISLHLLINHSLLTLCILIRLEGHLQVKVFACTSKLISVEVNGVKPV